MKGWPKRRHDGDLPAWALQLPTQGRYAFTHAEAEAEFPGRGSGVRQALRRLVKAGVLASPTHEFYVVVPLEYRNEGSPPATWFIDSLMRFLERPYYTALLSAAEFHGAAHQRPQEFQVMTDRPVRPLKYGTSGRGRIVWIVNSLVERMPVAAINVPTGTIRVGTPETTAFDLVRYAHRAGGIDQVATVLVELGELLNPATLGEVATIVDDVAATQRLGYMLSTLGHSTATAGLINWIEQRTRAPHSVKLRRERDTSPNDLFDSTWHVVVNSALEPDL